MRGNRAAPLGTDALKIRISVAEQARLSMLVGRRAFHSLAGRINDCNSRLVITADEGRRGGKLVPLKKNVDEALANAPGVERVLVVENTGNPVPMKGARDVWWHEAATGVDDDCPPAEMGAEDPALAVRFDQD